MHRALTREVLNDMSDEQIDRKIDALRTAARRRDGMGAQVELCYAQRESEWRKIRKIRHAEYLKQTSRRYKNTR